MATILLSAAGAAIGQGFGGTILGLSGAVIGRAVGATVGRAIDQRLLGGGGRAVETGRIDRLRIQTAGEGAPVARLWGQIRVTGHVIWAAPLEEEHNTATVGGGKGTAPKSSVTEISYRLSAAIALCEGPILGVSRVWADGEEIPPSDLGMTVYHGGEDQLPDPVIAAHEGEDAPAYRGIAYVVVDRLDLSRWGNRMPQLSFEVTRAARGGMGMAHLLRAVAVIPGTGEYALATQPVSIAGDLGETAMLNTDTPLAGTDFLASLKQLRTELPKVCSASLVVSWFGDDLRAGHCSVRPKVESKTVEGDGMVWRAGGITRAEAQKIARHEGRPVYGGTPADESVVQAIRAAAARGLKPVFYPFILMEQQEGNSLPNPWGGEGQPVMPWRGRITTAKAPGQAGSTDGTVAAGAEVAAFFGNAQAGDFTVSGGEVRYHGPDEWGYRRFILHYAHLCALAGGVDAFLIGSEMRGLTQIRASEAGRSWAFDAGLGGWTAYHATASLGGGGVEFRPGNANPRLLHNAPGVIDGRRARFMVIDMERIAPRTTGTWIGRILYGSENHPLALSYQARFADPPLGERVRAVVDMWALPSGGADWKNSTAINQFRIDLEEGGPNGAIRFHGIHIVDDVPSYPAVSALRSLAADVRAILGPDVRISYAADWSEYFGHHPGGGELRYHLDPLWADANVDFVGIDNYMPLSDWRDGEEHLDAQAWRDIHDPAYLMANIEGGEGYDWYYADDADRAAQIRSPIEDGAHGEPWVWRYKDLRNWWGRPHHERVGGLRSALPTAWQPRGKPIWFTEIGCAALDRGANQPNKFLDALSSESLLPHYSSGRRDDAMQAAALAAIMQYWADPDRNPQGDYGGPMLDMGRAHVWAWDARPWPAFPARTDLWSDGPAWLRGHWLNGRASAVPLADLVADLCREAGVAAFDTSGLFGQVRGFVLTGSETGRAALQQLMLAYGFDAFEDGGVLRFRMRAGRVDRVILPEMLAEAEGLAAPEFTRAAEAEVSGRVLLNHIDAGGSHESATTEARLPGDADGPASTSELSLALTRGEGRMTVSRWLAEARVAREGVRLALPPSQGDLVPGDVIALQDASRWRVDRIERAEAITVEAARIEPGLYRAGEAGDDLPAARAYLPPMPVGFAFLDLPLLRGDEVPHAPHLAVTARPWPGSVAVWMSEAGEGGYAALATVSAPALMGVTLSPLAAAASGVFDRGPALRIRMRGGQLGPVAQAALFAGANAIAIGDGTPDRWEVMQFAHAEPAGDGEWLISGRLRGQAGTDAVMPLVWPEGSLVVLLDGAVRQLPLAPSTRGVAHHYRLGPALRAVDDASYRHQEAAFPGVGLRPLSPCHLRVRGRAVSWIRRTRIGGDGWDGADVPLGEDSESYLLRLLRDGTLLYREVLAVPQWQAPAGLWDGVAEGGDFVVDVAQLSAVYGPGPSARKIVNV